MRRAARLPLLPLLLLLRATPCAPFSFVVAPGKRECFSEPAKASERVAGEWAAPARIEHGVAAYDALVVSVRDTSGDTKYSSKGTAHGSFSFVAERSGAHEVCFENAPSALSATEVVAKVSVGTGPDLIQLATAGQLSPLEMRIKKLHESMRAVRDLQDGMREAQSVNHASSASTRSWLLWFTVLEACVLVAVSLWQILYLKSFFEVRRVV